MGDADCSERLVECALWSLGVRERARASVKFVGELCLLVPRVSVTLILVGKRGFRIWASLKLGSSFSIGPHPQHLPTGPGKKWGSHCECPEGLHLVLLTTPSNKTKVLTRL